MLVNGRSSRAGTPARMEVDAVSHTHRTVQNFCKCKCYKYGGGGGGGGGLWQGHDDCSRVLELPRWRVGSLRLLLPGV